MAEIQPRGERQSSSLLLAFELLSPTPIPFSIFSYIMNLSSKQINSRACIFKKPRSVWEKKMTTKECKGTLWIDESDLHLDWRAGH